MAQSDNTRGILFMCVSMLAFTVNDTLMKAATATVPLFEAIFLRGILATLALVALAMATLPPGWLRPPAGDLRLVLWRTAGDVSSTAFFLIALQHMPLANLSAIMQSLPLAVTLGAAVFLGEHVGWRRTTAIIAGSLGVLLIIRPGAKDFDIWALMGLASVAGVVVRDLTTRRFGRAMPSVVPAVWASGAVTLMGALGMALEQPILPPPATLIQTIAAAAFVLVGYLTAIKAMRVGDLGLVAPFRFTSLLWAILLGWLIFGTLPGWVTLLGAAIVVGSGIYMLVRERKVRMSADPASPQVADPRPAR